MILEITTLGAGTFDVESGMKTLEEVLVFLHPDNPIVMFKQTPGRGGTPILLNTANIVSIKAKR